MFYRFENNNSFICKRFKKLSEETYVTENGNIFTKEQFDEYVLEGKLTEITESEFLASVTDLIKQKNFSVIELEQDIIKLNILFRLGNNYE